VNFENNTSNKFQLNVLRPICHDNHDRRFFPPPNVVPYDLYVLMKVLCVAEKPSVAKTIACILSAGASTSQAGRDQYCRNFCFPYRLAPGHGLPGVGVGSIDVVVTSVRGHLTQSDFSNEYREWRSCRPASLLTAPIVTSIGTEYKKIAQNLSEQVRDANLLLIWTDCDREGEHIGSEIVQLCRKAVRNITVKRAKFSAIINE
jgi:DNA topoisomerase-3